ncbi:hypothetical protein ONZ45_g14442 [Pleurotus djamor]|nr:hypothetical protein ONZ45_g14442 [Pleurotus djamor]
MGNKPYSTYLFEQLYPVPRVETADLSGKVAIVIGANTGIGYETAKHFVKMGAQKVIMGCRNQARGEAAVKRLRQETKRDSAELRIIDLASFPSVQSFVEEFNNDFERLDILVANAAVFATQYEETSDGWEKSMQVNHLAQSLLILLLLPKIVKTAELEPKDRPSPRIVIVASEVHQDAVIPTSAYESTSILGNLASKEVCLPYDAMANYRIAKLLNISFTQALSEHLPPSQRTPVVDCANPGFCRSELARGPMPLKFRIMRYILGRTPEQGSRQVVWAAVASPSNTREAKNGEDAMRGQYISFSRIEEPGDVVISEKGHQFKQLIWSDTLRILSGLDDRVQDIVMKYLR